MTKIIDIEGVGVKYADALSKAGISTIEHLLEKCASPKDRQVIEELTGISHALILAWTNHADLFRIKGVGSEYSDLLEAAGVDTVPELAQRIPENLHKKLVEINTDKKLVRQMPTLAMVTDWIAQAKKLPRVIFY